MRHFYYKLVDLHGFYTSSSSVTCAARICMCSAAILGLYASFCIHLFPAGVNNNDHKNADAFVT